MADVSLPDDSTVLQAEGSPPSGQGWVWVDAFVRTPRDDQLAIKPATKRWTRSNSTKKDAQAFIENDASFHSVLVTAGANRVVEETYRSLRQRQLRMGFQAVTADPHRSANVLREHQDILQALRQSDADTARQLMAEHLRSTLRAVIGHAPHQWP